MGKQIADLCYSVKFDEQRSDCNGDKQDDDDAREIDRNKWSDGRTDRSRAVGPYKSSVKIVAHDHPDELRAKRCGIKRHRA